MNERNMRIVFSSGISGITEQNSSFDRGVLRVAYTGKNRNNSFISKETFERCMPSIYNCPIVCSYDREADRIGGHDMEIVSDDGGNMRIVNVTQPVGVIPESATYHWEEIEDDGGIHEYLCIDALLWKRQEAYQKIRDNGVTEESMEISVKEGRMENGVYMIDRFEYTAFCLLGTAEPCYEGAALEMFSHNEFKRQLAEMMMEFKQTQKEKDTEGGNETVEEKDKQTNEAVPEKDTFALESQFRDELLHTLEEKSEKAETCWGQSQRYFLWDYDHEANEVYVTDVTDWNLYALTYAMDGDRVTVDFESKKRMKLTLAPFDEGDQAGQMGELLHALAARYAENDAQWTEKYQAATERLDAMEDELGALRKFKADTEGAEEQAKREQVFSRFEELSGVEAFEALREEHDGYSAEELEEKCFAIRGRVAGSVKFSHERQERAPKLAVEKTTIGGKEPYGGVFAEYGFSPEQK